MPHSHKPGNASGDRSVSNIKTAFFLNLGFTIVEFIGGTYTNSIAIIADSLHDFGDSLSLGLSWFLQRYSRKKRTLHFSYGYRRFSLLAALINSAVLIIGSFFVLSEAVPRILFPEPSKYGGMLALALLGIAVNGFAALRVKTGSSMNERIVSWHLLEDVFGWVAVLAVSVVNLFFQAPLLDPLLAVAFTFVVLYNVVKNMREILKIFLQATPSSVNVEELESALRSIEGVRAVHDMHVWSLDNERHILTVHVVVPDKPRHEKMKSVKERVREVASGFGISHVTVELEDEGEGCRYAGGC